MSRRNDAFDTYLLHVFSTLMDERSISRTATRLERSTYMVAAALDRLRLIFDDPLLLRDGPRLLPTERALELQDALQRMLGRHDPRQPRLEAPARLARRLTAH